MARPAAISLLECFAVLEDPRQAAKVLYPMPEIILLLLSATLAVPTTVSKSSSGAGSSWPSCAAFYPAGTAFPATTP